MVAIMKAHGQAEEDYFEALDSMPSRPLQASLIVIAHEMLVEIPHSQKLTQYK